MIKMSSGGSVNKTRQLLLEAARQAFAKVGFRQTTMNDIAAASNRGRRTLYTYFSSKEDVLSAVVEQELSSLTDRLRVLAEQDVSPEIKLMDFIFTHLDTVRDIVHNNGTLEADFFHDSRAVERVRRVAGFKEYLLLKKILIEGIEKKCFNIQDVNVAATILMSSLRGLEVPYMKDSIANRLNERRDQVTNFILKGLS